MAVRSPHLYATLRGFCLAGFAALQRDVDRGAEIPFSFEEHGTPGRPALYEYRPLLRAFVEDRARALSGLPDAARAVEELQREPAAAIFARAHAGTQFREDEAIFRSVLLPLLVETAEAAGGTDWQDEAFDRAYKAFERSLFGAERAYAAVAPLVGISVGAQVELGGGLRVRVAASGELSAHWAEAQRLLPPGFEREPDRVCVLELEQALPRGGAEPPDAPGEVADAVTALRLATAGAIAAGPVLFERLDWRPYGIRPVLPIAATQPPGEATRLDSFRGGLAARLRERLATADDDRGLADALDHWELSLFQDEPFRSEQLRTSLESLLGAGEGAFAAAMRAAALLGESGRERGELLRSLRTFSDGGSGSAAAADAVRRALLEVLLHGSRDALVEALDEALLGMRPRPAATLAAAG